MIYTGGEYHDMLMFGMTSDEFSTGHGSTLEA
jgi:hypothetical protein